MIVRETTKLKPAFWLDALLFALVVAFTVYSARAFSQRPPHPAAQVPRKMSRALASIAQASVREKSTQVVELACPGGKVDGLRTGAALLRLSARRCGADFLRARNETTGEDLLLFPQGEQVSTNYFPLKEGRNQILLEWKKGRDKHAGSTRFTIERTTTN